MVDGAGVVAGRGLVAIFFICVLDGVGLILVLSWLSWYSLEFFARSAFPAELFTSNRSSNGFVGGWLVFENLILSCHCGRDIEVIFFAVVEIFDLLKSYSGLKL